MKRPAVIATVIGAVLFSIIYFGLNTKPSTQRAAEKSRAQNLEATSIQNILSEARDSLNSDKRAYLEALNTSVREAKDDDDKVSKLKTLSSAWFQEGYPIISGYYAEEIANITKEHDAWSMAGTTYILGMRKATNNDDRLFARSKAISTIESAISLDGENVSDKINLALIYVEAPDTNPMQGILMLKDLNEKYPDNVSVLNQLGRLAIQTNQTDKALERLTKAYTLEPDNTSTACLLASAYEQAKDVANTEKFKLLCSK